MILRRPPQAAHALRSAPNTRASRAAHPKTMQSDVGFHHISFKVGNVDDSAGDLKAAGVDIDVEPFDAEGTDIRLSFFNGPNDVLLQLFQREPDPA